VYSRLLCVLAFAALTRQARARETPPPTPTARPHRQAAAKVTAANLRHALERAASFLSSGEINARAIWFTTQAAALLGPQFTSWAQTLKPAEPLAKLLEPNAKLGFVDWIDIQWWLLRALPEQQMPKLVKPSPAPASRTESRHFEDKDFGDPGGFMFSMACPKLNAEQHAKWLDWVSEKPTHSYRLTFQLLGLAIGYNQHCLTPPVLAPLRKDLTTRVWAEVLGDRDTLDAFHLEQIAALCYAQACEWIPSDVVGRLIAEQGPSGSWGVRESFINKDMSATENLTASMAFYVLARSWTLRYASAPGPKPPQVK